MKLNFGFSFAAVALALATHTALATTPPATTAPEMTAAEVKKVDRETKKITLKHEPIKHLDMPAMTMVFQVKDDKLLDAAKAGDKIAFGVERVKGGYAITAIEVKK